MIKKYSQDGLDLDAIASSVKLELSESQKQSFAKDICDMLNYCYENLYCESADGTLELSLRWSKTLGELRDDEPVECGCIAQMLDNSPLVQNGMIAVPKAIGSEGRDE